MSSASFNPDVEKAASEFRAAFADAYQRYLRGLRAVSDSYSVPVGLTLRESVWTLNKATLWRYRPTWGRARRVPLLLVYALINKPYIFDLRPGRSFIEFMLAEGFEIYLLDWGAPGLEDRYLCFDDYVADYLPRAIRKLLRVSGTEQFDLLGYCIGGTLTTLYAAMFPDAPIRNFVLLAAPVDFAARQDSIFANWLDERYFDVDRFVDSLGNIPAELLTFGSKLLKPVENYVGAYTGLWEKLEDETAIENWQAMHRWVHDGVPFAGEAFRQWVNDFVRGNKLVKGELVMRGRPLSLKHIHAPLLNVIAEYDHIVPPSHSMSIMELVASKDKQLEEIPAGHVGIMAGKGARYGLWPVIARWLKKR